MRNVVEKLRVLGVKNVKGFTTEEIRNQRSTRTGFDVVDLCNNENRASLARIEYYLRKFIKNYFN